MFEHKRIPWALKICVGGGIVLVGGGRDRVGGCKYTPLYENGIKKTQNKSLKTTRVAPLLSSWIFLNDKKAMIVFHAHS